MARLLFSGRPLCALLIVGACLASAAACGNSTQSIASAGGGNLPAGAAGSSVTSGGAGAAGSTAEAGRGGAHTELGGGSNLAGEGGKPSGSSGAASNPSA